MIKSNQQRLEKSIRQILEATDAYSREDNREDSIFYRSPRFVQHLDEVALQTIEDLVGSLVTGSNPVILDLMTSIDSHVPAHIKPGLLLGLGMNHEELLGNRSLDMRLIQDLNQQASLPFQDGIFDAVLLTISIQYLTQPQRIFNETARILKPGGLFLVIFSNRSFETKAVKMWKLLAHDEKLEVIRHYLEETGCFERIGTFISMGQPRPSGDRYSDTGFPSDPVFAIYADRTGAGPTRPIRKKPEIDAVETDARTFTARLAQLPQSLECPYCGEALGLWVVTDNPASTWDHDLYICVNDHCPYLVRGWKTMYDQGNMGSSYRLGFDPKSRKTLPIPVPNLRVIKNALEE